MGIKELSEGMSVIGCKWVYKKKEVISEKEGKMFKVGLLTKENG